MSLLKLRLFLWGVGYALLVWAFDRMLAGDGETPLMLWMAGAMLFESGQDVARRLRITKEGS